MYVQMQKDGQEDVVQRVGIPFFFFNLRTNFRALVFNASL